MNPCDWTRPAKFAPSALLTDMICILRFKGKLCCATIQAGLVSMIVGLVVASSALIIEMSVQTWGLAAIATACALATFKSKGTSFGGRQRAHA